MSLQENLFVSNSSFFHVTIYILSSIVSQLEDNLPNMAHNPVLLVNNRTVNVKSALNSARLKRITLFGVIS